MKSNKWLICIGITVFSVVKGFSQEVQPVDPPPPPPGPGTVNSYGCLPLSGNAPNGIQEIPSLYLGGSKKRGKKR